MCGWLSICCINTVTYTCTFIQANHPCIHPSMPHSPRIFEIKQGTVSPIGPAIPSSVSIDSRSTCSISLAHICMCSLYPSSRVFFCFSSLTCVFVLLEICVVMLLLQLSFTPESAVIDPVTNRIYIQPLDQSAFGHNAIGVFDVATTT